MAAKALGWNEKCGNIVGTDADFTICDMDKTWTVDDSFPIYSKPNLDPLYGQTLHGKVSHTVVRRKNRYGRGPHPGGTGIRKIRSGAQLKSKGKADNCPLSLIFHLNSADANILYFY